MFEASVASRSFGRSAVLAFATHGLVILALALRAQAPGEVAPPVETPTVRLYAAPVKKPPPPEPGGGHTARGPVLATPRPQPARPQPADLSPVLTEVAFHEARVPSEAEEEPSGAADFDGQAGDGSGAGSGLGSGSGLGVGSSAAMPSHARRAWFVTNEWACDRPDRQGDAGRVVVRIRVTVLPAGTASEVAIVTPGPPVFNDRALSCARVAQYVSALDDSGAPIVGVAEFAIQFL